MSAEQESHEACIPDSKTGAAVKVSPASRTGCLRFVTVMSEENYPRKEERVVGRGRVASGVSWSIGVYVINMQQREGRDSGRWSWRGGGRDRGATSPFPSCHVPSPASVEWSCWSAFSPNGDSRIFITFLDSPFSRRLRSNLPSSPRAHRTDLFPTPFDDPPLVLASHSHPRSFKLD